MRQLVCDVSLSHRWTCQAPVAQMMGNAILMAEYALLTLTGYVQKINAAEWLAWNVKMPFKEGGGWWWLSSFLGKR